VNSKASTSNTVFEIETSTANMGKAKGGNEKKVSGNAKKAEAAANKAAQENAKVAQAETDEWSKGAKNSSKKYVVSSVLI
jgi:hypothetical protein